MKQRDKQKLAIMGVGFFIAFNLPFVLLYQKGSFSFWGYPSFYFFIFLIWLFGIAFSWYIIKKSDE